MMTSGQYEWAPTSAISRELSSCSTSSSLAPSLFLLLLLSFFFTSLLSGASSIFPPLPRLTLRPIIQHALSTLLRSFPLNREIRHGRKRGRVNTYRRNQPTVVGQVSSSSLLHGIVIPKSLYPSHDKSSSMLLYWRNRSPERIRRPAEYEAGSSGQESSKILGSGILIHENQL